jgi:hypothetical protein
MRVIHEGAVTLVRTKKAGPSNIVVTTICCLLLLLLSSHAAIGQSIIADNDVPRESLSSGLVSGSPILHYRELSFYVAQSFRNPQIMSDLGGQHLFLTDIRLTSRLFTTRHLFIGGNVDLKPLALHSLNTPIGRRYTYAGGGGAGLQFVPRVAWRWQPVFDVDGGFLAFSHDVPKPDTRRVNMTLDFGPGMLIPLKGNNAMRTGLWFFHFSDGNTAPRNPAFDGFMVYWSYTYRNFAPHLRRRR